MARCRATGFLRHACKQVRPALMAVSHDPDATTFMAQSAGEKPLYLTYFRVHVDRAGDQMKAHSDIQTRFQANAASLKIWMRLRF